MCLPRSFRGRRNLCFFLSYFKTFPIRIEPALEENLDGGSNKILSFNRKKDLKKMKVEKSRKSWERELNKMALKDSRIPSSVKDRKFTKKNVYKLIIKLGIRY